MGPPGFEQQITFFNSKPIYFENFETLWNEISSSSLSTFMRSILNPGVNEEPRWYCSPLTEMSGKRHVFNVFYVANTVKTTQKWTNNLMFSSHCAVDTGSDKDQKSVRWQLVVVPQEGSRLPPLPPHHWRRVVCLVHENICQIMLQIRELLWGLLLIGCAAASIQVQILPHYGEISVGASKFFVCEVVGEVKDIDWFDPSGEKILPNRQDISVSRTEEVSTLVIYKANMDNAGIYTCVAKDGEKEARATVRVTIYQKITFQNAPSPQEFNEGDDADIICDIVSSPPPTIVWKYKGFTIQFSKD
ncbi:hypothetical protein fugu_008655, partial [Takifugu bimaculatus]